MIRAFRHYVPNVVAPLGLTDLILLFVLAAARLADRHGARVVLERLPQLATFALLATAGRDISSWFEPANRPVLDSAEGQDELR